MSSGKSAKDDKLSKAGLIKTREEFEKRLILNVFEATRWNQTEAAKILKISRTYLLQKAKQFGILIKKMD